jgi:energy-coupling factor transporter transmembrane protein EcfT
MIYQYVVSLKNRNTRYIDLIGLLLGIMSVIFFTRELLVAVELPYLLGAIFVPAVLIWNVVQSSKGKKVYYSRALLIAALVWMKMPYFQWLTFVFIILALLEYQAKYALEIGFSDKEVVINSIFKKRYAWSAFDNIVLRDGIITLDFINNRIIQREVEDDEDDEADEDEFNDYCKRQLAKITSSAVRE